MNPIKAIYRQARHPRCEPTPFSRSELVVRALAIWGVVAVGVVFYPAWWWLLVAFVMGIAVVMHPFCLLSGRKHAPGGHWFHFEEDSDGVQEAEHLPDRP